MAAPRTPQAIAEIIAAEAHAQGVPPRLALAFADHESRLDPLAEGDRQWPYRDGGALYRRHVLERPELAHNPWRTDPSVWHSYGLFQLLAPFHVQAHEHPHVLLDPRINAQRGIATIRRYLGQAAGNLYDTRRRYVGCGPDARCAPETLERIDHAWQASLQKWGLA